MGRSDLNIGTGLRINEIVYVYKVCWEAPNQDADMETQCDDNIPFIKNLTHKVLAWSLKEICEEEFDLQFVSAINPKYFTIKVGN